MFSFRRHRVGTAEYSTAKYSTVPYGVGCVGSEESRGTGIAHAAGAGSNLNIEERSCVL